MKFQKDKPVQSFKSKVLVDGSGYPYENRFEKNQLWVIGNGNLNKNAHIYIDEGKAKEWDLRGFKFYSIDIPTPNQSFGPV